MFEFRNLLIIAGLILILVSGTLGDWTIWFGAPLVFLGIIFKYIDRGG